MSLKEIYLDWEQAVRSVNTEAAIESSIQKAKLIVAYFGENKDLQSLTEEDLLNFLLYVESRTTSYVALRRFKSIMNEFLRAAGRDRFQWPSLKDAEKQLCKAKEELPPPKTEEELAEEARQATFTKRSNDGDFYHQLDFGMPKLPKRVIVETEETK